MAEGGVNPATRSHSAVNANCISRVWSTTFEASSTSKRTTPPIIPKIGDDPGANLITFANARLPKRDRKRVGLWVVFYFHDFFSGRYFFSFDVL